MRSTRTLLAGAAIGMAALLGATVAEAHNWGCWRQPNRTVYSYVTAALSSQANAAISDWDSRTILTLPRVNYHTEISVFDGYYGNTGWAGLASIESASGCNILHGHARVNRSYSYTSNGYRGIFCQEVGHLFGLDHSNDGGCMGGGYYYSINTYYYVVQHNVTDIYNKYIGLPALTSPDGELAAMTPDTGEGPGLPALDCPEDRPRAVAFWHDRPHTLEEAVERSVAIVSGSVLRVNPGADLVVPVEGLPDGVDRIPTQRILFAVDAVLGGELKGRVIELFRTGNDEFTIAEDPGYVEGERYVLFLTHADRGMYRTIAPEGRLEITESGLVPASEREFLSELRGRDAASLAGELARLAPAGREEAAPEGIQLLRNATSLAGGASVRYSLPEASDVKLGVFDAQGRLVRNLVDGRQDGARWYTIEWDGRDDGARSTAAGVYFIRLATRWGDRSVTVVRLN